jgi:hypothetical protein
METYSFQRGKEFESQQEKYEFEFEKLKPKKSLFNNLDNEDSIFAIHFLFKKLFSLSLLSSKTFDSQMLSLN